MNAPLFPSSRPNIRARVLTKLPATVTGAGGIGVSKEGGVWVIEPRWEDLVLIAPGIALDPTTKEIWVRDPTTDVYNRMTLSGLGQALWTGTSDTSQTISAGGKNFTTQSGKDWPLGSYVMAIDTTNFGNWLVGQVQSYLGTSLQLVVPAGSLSGAGSPNSWVITKSTPLIGATAGGAGEDAGLAYIYANAPAGDPTAGRIGFNSATIGAINSLSVNHSDRAGNAIAAEIATWDDGTSAIKARVRIYDENDPTKFIIASINGAQVNNGAWSSFPVSSPVGTSLVTGSTVRVEVLRAGDKGTDGAPGAPGAAGAPGAQGPQGIQGVPGTPGAAGAVGPAGPAGIDGTGSGARYAWSTGLSGDPTSGHVGGNNAALASITSLRISEITVVPQDISAFLATMDDSTNVSNRGLLTIIGAASQTKFAQYFINAAGSDGGAFWTFPVTHVANGGIAFTSDEAVQVLFSRTGDKGSDGAGAGDMLGAANLAQGAGGVANTATARANLGLVIGTDVQAQDADLQGDRAWPRQPMAAGS